MNRDEAHELVRRRAGGCCEYCLLPSQFSPMPFHIDHIIARKHGGSDDADNLAFACFSCNGHKGPNIAGIDPKSGDLVPLFNPRRDAWTMHFAWIGPELQGLTAIGRATAAVLAINSADNAAVRRELMKE